MTDLVEENVLNFIGGVSALYFANTLKNLKWSFLPSQLVKFLKKDLIVRQIFLFFLVFVSIQLTKGGNDIQIKDKAISSIFLYIFMLIFPKQTLGFSLIEVFLFLIIYGIYYTIRNYDLESENKRILTILMYSIGGVMILLILIGNILYYLKQKKDKGIDFDYLKFFFADPESTNRNFRISPQLEERRKINKKR